MSSVSTWRMFAYMTEDEEGVHDEVRQLSEWQLEDAFRWARHRGYDHIYFCRTDEPATFEKYPAPEDIVHRFGP